MRDELGKNSINNKQNTNLNKNDNNTIYATKKTPQNERRTKEKQHQQQEQPK